MNRDFAVTQRHQFALVVIDQNDVVAEVGKASAGHQSDISRTHHGNAHRITFLTIAFRNLRIEPNQWSLAADRFYWILLRLPALVVEKWRNFVGACGNANPKLLADVQRRHSV